MLVIMRVVSNMNSSVEAFNPLSRVSPALVIVGWTKRVALRRFSSSSQGSNLRLAEIDIIETRRRTDAIQLQCIERVTDLSQCALCIQTRQRGDCSEASGMRGDDLGKYLVGAPGDVSRVLSSRIVGGGREESTHAEMPYSSIYESVLSIDQSGCLCPFPYRRPFPERQDEVRMNVDDFA